MSLEALRVIKFRYCLQRVYGSAFRTLRGREISKIDVSPPIADWLKLRATRTAVPLGLVVA